MSRHKNVHEAATYLVIVSAAGHYSLWPADEDPPGWNNVGKTGRSSLMGRSPGLPPGSPRIRP